jgi:hypothetical protein
MARTSIAASKAELYGLITTGGLPTGLTAAYDHEPLPGDAQKPAALTISTAGMTAVDYLIALRIYVSAEPDAEKAQDDLDSLIMAVDGRMTSGFGPSNWDVAYDPDLTAFVATNIFQVGREDDIAFR